MAEDEARDLLVKIWQCKDNKLKLYSKNYWVMLKNFKQECGMILFAF